MSALAAYLKWHYLEVWPKILVLCRNFTLFPYYYFSVRLHLFTLFSPWRKQLVKPGIGFHPEEILYTISFNLISRIIGSIVRSVTILYGIIFMLVFGLLFLIPSVVWFFIPIITFPFYILRKPDKENEAVFIINKYKENPKKIILEIFRLPIGIFILKHINIDYRDLKSYLMKQNEMTDLSFSDMYDSSKLKKSSLVQLIQFLVAHYSPFQQFLAEKNIKNEILVNTAIWFELLYLYNTGTVIEDLERIKKMPGIGHNWIYGYTVNFDKLIIDLTRKYSQFPLLVGRENELKTLENILLQAETNNALIIGNPGTGRHMLVETIAHRINTGLCHPKLSRKRVLMLDMHAIASMGGTVAEVKGILSDLLSEAEYAGNVIIVIDEIDKYTSIETGRIDLSDVFAKFARSHIAVIGITTPYGYHKYIETNSSVSLYFETIELTPPTSKAALQILEIAIAPVLESRYNIVVTYEALKKIIDDAERYISAIPYPAKAVELLDETCVYMINIKKRQVLIPVYIDEYLSNKMHTHIGELQQKEKEKLLTLETQMHKRVVNQEMAITTLASALRRRRLNISPTNKPIGSFLFLGPTGVGKTETAKTLSEIYFGSEDDMIRLDMSQYRGEEGMEKLIGSLKLGNPGELTSKLLDKPFSILLLDEFEKSDKNIFNLFLTLLDEGYIRDYRDSTVEAKNTIIIATSNAGSEFIRERINRGIKGDELQKGLIDYIQKEKIFSPELLNRFDKVVVFTPLSEGHLREVARLQLEALNYRLYISQEICINITDDLIKKLVLAGFDPEFGGRAMKRVVTEIVEDQIAQKVLNGKVKKGEKITIDI